MVIQTVDQRVSAGLTEREVQARRTAGQGNQAPPPTGRTYLQIVRENVATFINTILFLLGLALVLVGRPLDALVSVGVIALNILVSVVQEVRAKRTLDRVALLTRPTATVLREGQERSLVPEDLVLGDLVVAGPGDQIVLDGQLCTGRMQVDESLLTGESGTSAAGALDRPCRRGGPPGLAPPAPARVAPEAPAALPWRAPPDLKGRGPRCDLLFVFAPATQQVGAGHQAIHLMRRAAYHAMLGVERG